MSSFGSASSAIPARDASYDTEAYPHASQDYLKEVLSVAPMMEQTTPAFRSLLRLITKRTVLYTEMVVDDTVIHNAGELDHFVGSFEESGPSVVQIGGSRPENLAQASEILQNYNNSTSYQSYQEINLNCGCPSSKVSRNSFGARLMLSPDLVREIVHTVKRRVDCPVTVKCRLGVAKQRDKYEDLVEFIREASAGGARKFIIHARDCVLGGLTTKQNRDIPPLRYEVLAQLRKDFPELIFVLNGGVRTLEQVRGHVFGPESSESSEMGLYGAAGAGGEESNDSLLEKRPHGVMIGRAVWSDPLMLSQADTMLGAKRNVNISRRELLEQYGSICDSIQDRNEVQIDSIMNCADGPRYSSRESVLRQRAKGLVLAASNLFCGVKMNKEYAAGIHHEFVTKAKEKSGDSIRVSEFLTELSSVFPEDVLDAPIGKDVSTIGSQQRHGQAYQVYQTGYQETQENGNEDIAATDGEQCCSAAYSFTGVTSVGGTSSVDGLGVD